MKVQIQTAVMIATFMSTMACSSLYERGAYRSSSLRNINPAPKSMSPPKSLAAESTVIDDTYMRTSADYHYSMGEALSMEGESQRAIDEFKLTLVYDSKSVDVRLRLASEYLKQGLISESIEQAEEVAKLDSKSIEARKLLGGLYTSIKMYAKAKEQYHQVLKLKPKDSESHIYLGALFAEEGKFTDSEKYFKKLIKNKDYKTPYLAHYYLGKVYYEWSKKFHNKAEKSFKKSLSLKPKSIDVVMILSQLYKSQGKTQKAIKLLESFQDKFGPRQKIASYLGNHYLEEEKLDKALVQLEYLESFDQQDLNNKMRMALILIELKKFDPAIRKLKDILRVAPQSNKIRFYLAAIYEEIKDFDAAVYNYSKIASTSQYYAEAMVHAAYIYKEKSDTKNAINIIKKAIDERQDIPKFFTFYASLLDFKKQHKEALVVMKKAIKLFPENKQVNFFLGSVADKTGGRELAISSMKKVLSIDSEFVQALNYLAYIYAESNQNLDEAHRLASKALKLQPEDPYVLDTMGWVYFKKKDFDTAIKYLEAAHKVKSDESILAEHLGDAYYRKELADRAKTMYLKAIALEDDYVKIEKIRSKITSIEKQKNEINIRRPAAR